jgi:hypothetical protein
MNLHMRSWRKRPVWLRRHRPRARRSASPAGMPASPARSSPRSDRPCGHIAPAREVRRSKPLEWEMRCIGVVNFGPDCPLPSIVERSCHSWACRCALQQGSPEQPHSKSYAITAPRRRGAAIPAASMGCWVNAGRRSLAGCGATQQSAPAPQVHVRLAAAGPTFRRPARHRSPRGASDAPCGSRSDGSWRTAWAWRCPDAAQPR